MHYTCIFSSMGTQIAHVSFVLPVSVAERSKACTVFPRSDSHHSRSRSPTDSVVFLQLQLPASEFICLIIQVLCFWTLSIVLSCPVYFSKHNVSETGFWAQTIELVPIGTSSIDWTQLSRSYLKTEKESSLRNVVFWKINRTVFR
jgi:hypothetical protein